VLLITVFGGNRVFAIVSRAGRRIESLGQAEKVTALDQLAQLTCLALG